MNPENFQKEAKIIDLVKANFVALKYFVLFAIIFATPFFLIWNINLSGSFSGVQQPVILWFLPVLIIILGIILHELLHGIFFAKFAKNGFKSVKFGILWKMLTPYCHCEEPLKIKHYKIALLAPLIIMGIIPAIISLFTGSQTLLIFGIFFSGAAAGDIMIYQLIKKENPEDFVQDHPTEAGYFIFRQK